MPSRKVLGIDLGTTNSAFAVLEGGEPEILVNSEGDRTTPSVVTYEEDGSRVVGKAAKNQIIQKPDRTVASIKRHVGDEEYTVEIDDQEFTPEEVSAAILQKMKSDAEEYLGEDVDRAVITVPAYFNDRQRNATKDAGEIAGFEVERIINEPTAAAMAYGLDEEEDKTVLVFDLGGGTFDVSILDIGGGVYEVVSTNGDNDLGGEDWDQVIMDYIIENVKEEYDIDLTEDDQAMQRLKEAAEEAKIDLSSKKQTMINLPFIAQVEGEPISVEEELTRAKFETLSEDLVERTVEPTELALEQANYDAEDIDEIILVGGTTRMPMVREKVEEIFGKEPRSGVNPDEAVALGASIQGGVVDQGEYGEQVDDIVLLDVTPLSLGVETKGGLFETIIDKDTTIPTRSSKVFTTAEDGQSTVKIRVFQGERELAEENEFLGEFELTGIPEAPAGHPEIEVKFKIDRNGIVHVTAEEKNSELEESIQIEGETGLSDEDIERMKEEAAAYEEEDEKRRKRIEAKNKAEKVINRASTLLEEHGEADIPDGVIHSVQIDRDNLKELLSKEEVTGEEVQAGIDKLEDSLDEFSNEIYD